MPPTRRGLDPCCDGLLARLMEVGVAVRAVYCGTGDPNITGVDDP